MPITAAGNLSVVVSYDLGGLGGREGAPVPYNWALPGFTPILIPCLAILALLALKSNRTGAAWLIWIPLGLVTALTLIPGWQSDIEQFLDSIGALAIGLAAVWLLSSQLARKNRVLTFFCLGLAVVGFSVGSLVARLGGDWRSSDTMPFVITLALAGTVIALALSISGRVLRNRFQPWKLVPVLVLVLPVAWLAVALPVFLYATKDSNRGVPWNEFFMPLMVVAALTFAIMLPFLLLSVSCGFFRERLKALLQISPEKPPAKAILNEPNLEMRCQ